MRDVARRGLRGAVLTAIAGGTLAFALAAPSTTTPLTSPDLSAVGAEIVPVERHAAGALAASRFEARDARPATTMTIVVDGEPREVTTWSATVGEALADAGIIVDADDIVSAPLGQSVTAEMRVAVTTVDVEDEHKTDTDSFETIEEEDGSLLKGKREVVTEGVDGVTATTTRITRRGDGEVERELVARAVVSERVDEVVRIGTAEPAPQPARAQSSSSSASSTSVPSYSSGDTRAIGAELAAARGWGGDQFSCLDQLWTRESNWRTTAQNPSSGAYGIPQSLPGSKMASAGSDWQTNPATQITWGLNYIAGRYGTPCGALSHSHARGWY